MFTLSRKLLTDLEISVSGKGLDFSPTPTFINEADFRRDLTNFARKMRFQWFFCNEPTEDISEIPAFRIKFNCSPLKGHPALQTFLSQMEGEIFSLLPGNSALYNVTKEEWKAMRGLAKERNIVIKPADKRSCVVECDKLDF